jgi:hypothetical protein
MKHAVMPFVCGFGLAQSVAWFFGTYVSARADTYESGEHWRSFLLPMVALPSVGAWIVAEVMIAWRRPRLFSASWSTVPVRWTVQALLGVIAALLTIGVEGILLAVNSGRISDWWIMGLSGPIVAAGVLRLVLRGKGETGCPSCGYDWRGLKRCPECGTSAAGAKAAA